jgi:hypothetical protein
VFDDKQAIDIIQSMKGNPDQEITIYRAVPKGVNTINSGDWVTTVESYAKQHAIGNMGAESGEVISKTVKAKDIFTNGDSIMEWGYSPAESGRQLAKVDEAGFYSKAEQAVLDSAPPVLPKDQLRGWFEGRGVSQSELSDLGILAMIDAMPEGSKITKQGLLDHIDENRIELYPTVLRHDEDYDYDNTDPSDVVVLDAEQEYSRMDDSIDASGERDVYFGAADLASWKVIPDDDYAYDWGVEALSDLGSRNRQDYRQVGELATDERDHYPFLFSSIIEWVMISFVCS